MNKLIIAFMIIMSFFISNVVAQTSEELTPVDFGTVQQNAPLNLLFDCSFNNTDCTTSATCNATLQYPNQTLMFNNLQTGQAFFPKFNKTIPDTSVLGLHSGEVTCCQSGYCGQRSYFFDITPNGEKPTIAKAIFYISLLALLIFFLSVIFVAHMNDESHLARFWWFSFMWILIWAILFIGWNMARDFLTSQGAIEGILWWSWLIIGLIYPFFILGLVLYTFYWIYQQKEVQKLITRGFSLEDAEARVKGRGRGMNKW